MRLKNVLIVVRDIELSKRFYSEAVTGNASGPFFAESGIDAFLHHLENNHKDIFYGDTRIS